MYTIGKSFCMWKDHLWVSFWICQVMFFQDEAGTWEVLLLQWTFRQAGLKDWSTIWCKIKDHWSEGLKEDHFNRLDIYHELVIPNCQEVDLSS